ncbi:hypothetical protein [Agrobacterium tumefaciens]|uniref:hypothetical protein n=1 Tax=Agrobacterium tumefaciens TaxID=358 RepID=UPI00287C409C|nr:hypothetical protein [Agrobacterium tumefaciens]MDS7594909.1 hypothetical protein [Agrobacterium tumefaciens]
MKIAGKMIAKLRSALLVASVAAIGTTAAAEGLLVTNYETNTAAVKGLMEPIMPLINSSTASNVGIIQLGTQNNANASIDGTSSLALIQQSGSNNRAVQAIEGTGSALLLVQGGQNNSVVQASQGNDNFQLVGVSGNNNQIAYVQKGDNLAGVLDVRDSVNSTVVAIQTPQSGNFMMPTGLRGLENKTVVVVPGRMYVLPKR